MDHVKKAKQMDFQTVTLDGMDYFVADDGEGNIHQIDMRAIGSWGLLLGITDPTEVIAAILRFKEEPVSPGQPNIWTPMYDALNASLDAMSASGVPPEYMEDLMDPALGAPVPGPEMCEALEAARANGRNKINESPEPPFGDVSAAVTEVLAGHEAKIKEDRLAFVDKLAPVYEVPQEPVQEFADVNVPSGIITPGILAQ